MNGYIFDWNENSEKILNGDGYTTVGHQFMEQVALFRYLMDKGYSKDDVDRVWRNTNSIAYQKVADDKDETERLFARIWGKAAKWKNNVQGNEIVIYQSEIDFINNMEVLPWIKQYVLTLLCVYKWWGREWCRYDKKIRTFCFSCTDIKKERDRNAEKITECIDRYHPYEVKIIDVSLSFKIMFGESDSIVAQISNPRDIDRVLKLIRNSKICLNCGNTFEYNSHSILNCLCPDCHNQKVVDTIRNCNKRRISTQR